MLIPRTCTTPKDRIILARRRLRKLIAWRNARPVVQVWKAIATKIEATFAIKYPGRRFRYADLYAAGKALPEFKAFQKFHHLLYNPKERAALSDVMLFRGRINLAESRYEDEYVQKKAEEQKRPDWDLWAGDPAEFPKQEADDKIPPDPAEDTGDYTELDPSGEIGVDSSTDVSINSLDRDVDARLYKDDGAGAWDGDFDWRFNFRLRTGSKKNSYSGTPGIFNSVDDIKAIVVAGGDGLFWRMNHYLTSNRFIMLALESGGLAGDTYAPAVSEDYLYYDWERDYDGGGASQGRMTGKIYSDTYTTLVDTLVDDLAAQVDFRYPFWVNSYNDSVTNYYQIADINDLDFQGTGPTPPGGDIAVLRRRRSA